MEKIVEQGLLYDFYGELLTEHQRNVYEDAVYHDMSLAEIAEEYGISRQGVHDLLKRCDRILIGYEEKLHLVEKFEDAKKKVREISALAEEGKKLTSLKSGEQPENRINAGAADRLPDDRKSGEQSENRTNAGTGQSSMRSLLEEIEEIAAKVLENF